MAITTAQRNAGYRQLCLSLATGRPDRVEKLFRIIIKEVRDGANATQKEVARAIGVELYEAAFGATYDARLCRKFVDRLLQNSDGDIDGRGFDDAVTFQPVTVI